MKEKVITVISVILGLALAGLLFFNWNPEGLLRGEEAPVSLSQLEQGGAESFTGSPAGQDIPRLSGAADFDAMGYGIDYATAEPTEAIPTGVYSLQPWSSYFSTRTYRGRTTTGHRREQVIQSQAGAVEYYNQYYLLRLADGSCILAQIPEADADAIRRGEEVTLPIGEKTGMTDTARAYLRDICEEYGASMDGVLYTFDDAWYEEHSFTLFLLRFGAAVVVFFVTAVGLVLTGNRIFRVKSRE